MNVKGEYMDIRKIGGTIQPYLWGDSYFIAQLLQKEKSASPQAELWMGTHPQGPSRIIGEDLSLQEYIEHDPEKILGSSHLERFGVTLPFLFKILAINEPLSLQVHPSSDLAVEGYRNEENKRGTVDVSDLNYKDDKQKDEVLYALSPVTAMAGFRPLEDIRDSFSSFLTDSAHIIEPGDTVETFFRTLLNLDSKRRFEVIGSLREYLAGMKEENTSMFLSPFEIAKRALDLYDDDIMVCAPFFLNVVHLEPGQALHVKPGTLHAYVYGHAAELMSCSDNVLRGGLTRKKVDVEELVKVVSFTSEEPTLLTSKKIGDTVERIEAGSEEFAYQIYHAGTIVQDDRRSVELALVVEGKATFIWKGRQLRCTKGDSVIIPASIRGYELENDGLIISASVPLSQ